MTKIAAASARRARRADAERNIAGILDAALEVLAGTPEASMAEIAAAANVTRQTVYAHYESRESLLVAAAERARDQSLAAIEAAAPADGPPGEALARLTTAWWQNVVRRARVLEALAAAYPDAAAVHELHAPIIEQLERLIRRGRRSGDFYRDVPVQWQAASFLGLMHAAAEEVAAGRLEVMVAGRALQRSVDRLLVAT